MNERGSGNVFLLSNFMERYSLCSTEQSRRQILEGYAYFCFFCPTIGKDFLPGLGSTLDPKDRSAEFHVCPEFPDVRQAVPFLAAFY